MPERVTIRVDGRAVEAPAGASLAVALLDNGFERFRTSVRGEPRGPLCAMGICFECRVTIDGVPHRRACLEACVEGMDVRLTPAAVPSYRPPGPEAPSLACAVAVVGAGPAGIAAACRAAEAGADVVVLDEGFSAGGQIWRGEAARLPPAARAWLGRLSRSGARVVSGAAVADVAPGRVLVAECRGGGAGAVQDGRGRPLRVRAERIVIATGARERFLPFPGWTLPNVLGIGAAQALLKSGASFRGKRAVIAGSGPLLLPVAALMRSGGARLALVAEQAPARAVGRFALGLLGTPSKLAQAARHRAGFLGTPYRLGTWVTSASGEGRVQEVTLTDGVRSWTERCDVLCSAYGLVPNVELARVLGCAVERGAVSVSDEQETSVPGVFCAGEPTGVAGVEQAVVEGEIAGLAAAGRAGEIPALEGRRSRGRAFAAALERVFVPREELRRVAAEGTLVCRCEDVPLGALRHLSCAREAKLATRAGMGPCQGRVCGPALELLFGWEPDTVRSPLKPVGVAALAGITSES